MLDTQRSSHRAEFQIKTGSMRNTQNSRQRLLPAEIPGEARRKRERNEIEQTILKLQNRCVKNAEQIEIQSEKEAFYDMEILRLTKMVEAARLQKPQHKLNLPDQQHGDQNSRDEPKAKQIDESSLGQAGLIAKRKERAVLDELFTKVEKTINAKEQKLIQTLQRLLKAKTSADAKDTNIKALLKQESKLESHLKNEYLSRVNEYEKLAMAMNSSQHRISNYDAEEIDFDGNEAQEVNLTDPNANIGPNYSSVTFNNSVIDTIDNVRHAEVQRSFTQLHNLKAMHRHLVVMTQEDDLDFIMKMYANGKNINQAIYAQIKALSNKVGGVLTEIFEEDNLTTKLSTVITQNEGGMNSDTPTILQYIQSLDAQIDAYGARCHNLSKRIELGRSENDLFDTIKECLFIGDEMIYNDDCTITNHKQFLLKLADERSSQIQFITNAHQGFAIPEAPPQVTSILTDDKSNELLQKIVDFNNSQLKTKESERNRDNLISDNLRTIRRDIGHDINKHLGIDNGGIRRQVTQKRSHKRSLTKSSRVFTRTVS